MHGSWNPAAGQPKPKNQKTNCFWQAWKPSMGLSCTLPQAFWFFVFLVYGALSWGIPGSRNVPTAPTSFPPNKNVLADSEAYHGPELHFASNVTSTGFVFSCQHVAPQSGTYKDPGVQQPKKPKLGNRSNRPFLRSLEAWHGPQLHFASSVLVFWFFGIWGPILGHPWV